jgi:NADPH-dependent glutamate synthase beta subunit-like oxidoreductase
MVEIPDSEYIYKADLVLIALGFTGPSKALAKELAIKMVRHSSTYLSHIICSLV